MDAVLGIQSSLGDLPGWFIPLEDIHLTLVPPFETQDIHFVKGTLKTALQEMRQFKLRFLRVSPGPNKGKPNLVWIECGASEELISLKKNLLKVLGLKEKIPFIPHMTLVRFGKADAKNIARRRITRPLKLSMNVETVELFESPHKGGVGYTILDSAPLQLKP